MTASENSPERAGDRAVATAAGGIVGSGIGYWAGYTFLVDQVGRIAHKIFWERPLGSFDAERVLHSQTFWQIALPVAFGAVLGAVIARRVTT